MQSPWQVILSIVAALALVFSVLALVEIYTPPKVISAGPVGLASRLTLLERTVAAQAEALRNQTAARTEATTTRTDNDIRNLRNAMQSAFDQVGHEFGALNAKVAAWEQTNRALTAKPAEPRPTTTVFVPYVIKDGDTLATIATLFGISEQALQKANVGLDPAAPEVGRKITIPLPATR